VWGQGRQACLYASLQLFQASQRDLFDFYAILLTCANMVHRQALSKDEVDVDATWKVLSDAFLDIHNKNASSLSFEQLFRNAYKLVLKKKHDILYDKVRNFEDNYLTSHIRPKINSHVTPTILLGYEGQVSESQTNERRLDGEKFMKEIKIAFQDQQLCMGMITDVLMYMVSLSLYTHAGNHILRLNRTD
jgi:hypothetical protein